LLACGLCAGVVVLASVEQACW